MEDFLGGEYYVLDISNSSYLEANQREYLNHQVTGRKSRHGLGAHGPVGMAHPLDLRRREVVGCGREQLTFTQGPRRSLFGLDFYGSLC